MNVSQHAAPIALALIDVGERLRQVDPDFSRLIAASLGEHGLITPIEVGPADDQGRHALIAGAHRLAAARALGWATIEARVFDGDALAVEMREIDENLCRHELSALDRAAFLARRKEVWEALHPEARHGGRRAAGASGQIGHLTMGFSEAAADKVGLSGRTIRRLVKRHQALHPEVRRRLAATVLARSGGDLDALARLPMAEQLRALDLIEERGMTRVAPALAALGGGATARDRDEAAFLRFVKLWNDGGEAVRARIAGFVRANGPAAAPAERAA